MTRNRVAVENGRLIVEPLGLDKLWAFRRRVVVPLAHVRGATFDPGLRHEPRGWRGPGLGLPSKLAGTFHADGGRQFWNVSGFDKTIVVTLDETEHFDRLYLTVDDPDRVVTAINFASLGSR